MKSRGLERYHSSTSLLFSWISIRHSVQRKGIPQVGSDKKIRTENELNREGKKKLRGTKGNEASTENSGGMKRMLNIGRLKQSQKKKNRMKETKEGNL